MTRITTWLLIIAGSLAGAAHAAAPAFGELVRVQGTRDAGSAPISIELPPGVEDTDVATSEIVKLQTTQDAGNNLLFEVRLPDFCVGLGEPDTRPVYVFYEADAAAAPQVTAFFRDANLHPRLPIHFEFTCRNDGDKRQCVGMITEQARCALFGKAGNAKSADEYATAVHFAARRTVPGAGPFVLRHAVAVRPTPSARPAQRDRGLMLASTGRDRTNPARRTFTASWTVPAMRAGDSWVGFANAASQLFPVRIDVAAPRTREPIVLSHNRTAYITLAPGETHDRIVFDLPPALNRIVGAFPNKSGLPLDVELLPPHGAVTGPEVAPAPPSNPVALAARIDPANPNSLYPVLTGPQVVPGRWYLRIRNPNTVPIDVGVNATFLNAAAAPPELDIRDGAYFDPERPGHGVFITRSTRDRVLIWYTYDQSGAPTWYFAQLPQTAFFDLEKYSTQLYRYVWRNGVARAEPVGDAVLTLRSPRTLAFSWSLDGRTGSEMLEPLADCATGGGELSTWFAPAQPGYGFSVLRTPTYELDVVYLYDADGNPRWLVAQDSPDAAALDLLQTSGFCTTCTFTPVQSEVVGTLTRSFGASVGTARVDASFGGRLEGTWMTDAAIATLTSNPICR